MNDSKKLDVETVRLAASGQWASVLSSLGGLPSEVLDNKHHPCPKCGGEDRFRVFNDFQQTGGMLCNKCFKEENGDGFAALMWLTGCTFPEALKKVAEHLGVDAAKPSKNDPAKDLVFSDWSSELIKHFTSKKPGVTEESLLAAGARFAKYKRTFTVIAFPIIGESLNTEKPVGWVLFSYNGGTLPKWNRQGEVVGQVKMKMTYGSKPGLIGIHGIERLLTVGLPELVWKVEGVTDLLALWAIMPETLRDRNLVVTNANGAGETPRWQAQLLASHNINLIHDADAPGQAGAHKWTKAIASQSEQVIKNVQLPYTVEESKGKDIRDWFEEGHSYGDLLDLAEQAETIAVAKTEDGEVNLTKEEYPLEALILKKLQIEVLYEDESGKIRAFSTFLRKSFTIHQIDRLKLDTLIQSCGSPAMECISSDPDGHNTFSMSEARKAIALAASTRRGKNDERGIGVWQGLDDKGMIVIVGDSEAAIFSQDGLFRRYASPRVQGLVLDFGCSENNWVDFEKLEKNLVLARDHNWCQSVIDELIAFYRQWAWKIDAINEDTAPTIMAGMVLSTWVQTIWAWRPHIAITGQSNSGKSYLFESLGGGPEVGEDSIFGNLSFKQEKSSEAGVRQGLGHSAKVPLCDEFEGDGDRRKILQMLRAGSRGGTTAKGTASQQKAKSFVCRHIGWVAAIEAGLVQQPDANRFIPLDLVLPQTGKKRLSLPTDGTLRVLGENTLAIAIRSALTAKALAIELKSTSLDGIDPRMVESLAVPAAMLATATGSDEDTAKQLLLNLAGCCDKALQPESDHQQLLDHILSADVYCGSRIGSLAVSQILVSPSNLIEYSQQLEAMGIRELKDGCLFFACGIIKEKMMKGTDWQGKQIGKILDNLEGARPFKSRVAGTCRRGIAIPREIVGIDDKSES